MMCLLASLFLVTALPAEPPAVAAEPTAEELIASCRTMMPQDVKVKGRILLRNRRGIVQKEYDYTLTRQAGVTSLLIDQQPYQPAEASAAPILGTDVTWSDLTLDYLWWQQVSFDEEKESETVHGQVCSVLQLQNGTRLVRVWVDRKTGAMMQAEEWTDGKVVRRLWGTRIKKFGDRWAPNVLEVETIGSGHRTKITVEELT